MADLKRSTKWIRRKLLDRLNTRPGTEPLRLHEPDNSVSPEDVSEAELDRLHELIEDRKQVARNADISYHLWGLYSSCFRGMGTGSLPNTGQDGEWYDVKILKASTQNGLNEFKFELKGGKYRFVDDEERRGWRENLKFFSLFLYDDSGRCLIEVPMRMRVDSQGRDYLILSDGPSAFLPGPWTNDFINVRLKHQSLLNQEIRSQKHRDRLREIEDLRARFGIID